MLSRRKNFSAILAIMLIVGNLLMVSPAKANGEVANQISVNTEYQGSIQDGEMYYAFTLTSPGKVTLSMLRNTKSSWYNELTDISGNSLEWFSTSYGTTVTGYEEREVGLPKGTYYLKVSNNYNGSAVSFKFKVKFTAGSGYEKEINNSLESANPILVNTLYKGVIQYSGDDDYYIFTTPADGNVTLSMKRNTKSSWYMTLYSADGNSYKYFSTAYGTTATGLDERQIGLPKGTYIVAVENNTSTENIEYEFQAKFTAGSQYEKEENDELTSANLIQLNKTYMGALQSSSDDDFFAFTMPSDGNITLSMNRNTKSSWYLTLYSSDGTSYKYFSTAYGTMATGVEERQIGLPKGTYYVQVESNNSAQDVPYQFQVKYNAGNYYEKEGNNSLESANPIALNSVYKGVLQSSSDDDFYSFSVTKTQQVRVSIPRHRGVSWYADLYDENGNSLSYFSTAYGSTVTGNEERTYTLNPGNYYIEMSNNTSATDVPYEFALWTASPKLTPEQVKVINNKGIADTITVGGLGTGDVVKVYNASSGGTLLKSAKATSTGLVSMSVTQIGQKSGKIYVTVTKPGWTESARTAVEFIGEESNPLLASQVKVENNVGKPDVMTISSLGANDVVKVYDAKGKLIGVSMPATQGQAAIAFVQIGQTAGKVYATVTRDGMTESKKAEIAFVGEQTKALTVSQIVVLNNKGKADTITVSSLQKGDVIRVYDVDGKKLATATAASTQAISSVTQLGTSAGNVYVTITRTGMTESTKTKVSYKAE